MGIGDRIKRLEAQAGAAGEVGPPGQVLIYQCGSDGGLCAEDAARLAELHTRAGVKLVVLLPGNGRGTAATGSTIKTTGGDE